MSKRWIAAVLLFAGCDQVFDLNRPPIDAVDAPDDSLPRCPNNYIGNGVSFYRFSPSMFTWAEALADCRADETRMGAISGHTHLAVVSSATELLALIPTDTTWIGLSDLAAEGQFQWVSAEDATISPRYPGQPMQPPWSPTEPNDVNGEDCVAVQSNRLLFDYQCGDLNPLICECDDFASP